METIGKVGEMGIYSITSPSGRMYYGSSVDIPERWDAHRQALAAGRHGNKVLQRTADKYGVENMRFRVEERVDDYQRLIEVEQQYIDSIWGKHICMNLVPQAGKPPMGEIATKLLKQAWARPESKARKSAASKAVWERDGHKEARAAKISAAHSTPEAKAKLSAIAKEVMSRPGVKAKHSASVRAALSSPEVKAKISAASKATFSKPEARAKLAAVGKKTWECEAYQAKQAAATSDSWNNKEVRRARQMRHRVSVTIAGRTFEFKSVPEAFNVFGIFEQGVKTNACIRFRTALVAEGHKVYVDPEGSAYHFSIVESRKL
ncbi:GIY-YIG nuclease family protein [Cupriavidus sp. TMH.W2]|uniref:GIY-YIG nuclease family protein n=1 Tax=Cupriavidus sp. TMH.W2 TaxID=3434465 RepID=UPI003D78376E